ncbi:hypothetical protein I3842_Q105900 [Carya illinoinensis]|uniref:Uncharacterized protein n=1 Tax=Carya illinoinensis TaxID=32201 RepID=A0A922D6Q1_CARIL|nr:hypothetical protein I3842_Q105900 [Carya illinoinensis]
MYSASPQSSFCEENFSSTKINIKIWVAHTSRLTDISSRYVV